MGLFLGVAGYQVLMKIFLLDSALSTSLGWVIGVGFVFLLHCIENHNQKKILKLQNRITYLEYEIKQIKDKESKIKHLKTHIM